jgi:hypothetical protein
LSGGSAGGAYTINNDRADKSRQHRDIAGFFARSTPFVLLRQNLAAIAR